MLKGVSPARASGTSDATESARGPWRQWVFIPASGESDATHKRASAQAIPGNHRHYKGHLLMPRALFVTTVDITLQAFLTPFAAHLRHDGWRVDALASGAHENKAIADSFDERYDISWSRNPLALGNAAAARRVRHLIADGCYDLVWVHTPVAAFVTRRALRFRALDGPAIVYTAHGFHFHKGGNPLTNLAYRQLERSAAAWTDRIVTINEEDFAAARTFGTIPVDDVDLIRGIGVDTQRFRPDAVSAKSSAAARRGLGAAKDDVLITMIAEFTPNKRHDLALQAMKQVKHGNVRLALVGDGPLAEHVGSEIKRLGLDDMVKVAGYRKDVESVIAASDALLLCSRREGLNRSALEAMAMGKPVIGTPTRGIADAVGENAGGWIATSDKADALAFAIDAAADSAGERDRRGKAALERARQLFSLTGVLGAYDGVFEAAMEHRRAALDNTQRTYAGAKRALDVVFAALLIVVLSPILALVALGVLVTMGWPVVFTQVRPGRREEPFTLLKFRTMRKAAEGTSDVDAVASDEQRLTAFGRFLRATSLDELPQLFNILRGDMSFVGPRPLLTEYLEHYTPQQAKRHLVRPGMTGWAQVNGRNALSWDERLAMDSFYAQNYSFGMDARICRMTVGTVFSRRGVSAEGQATVEPFVKPNDTKPEEAPAEPETTKPEEDESA